MGKRLFISVDLSQPLCDEIKAVQELFTDLPGVSLTNPDQAHITLKFLGDVPDDDIEPLENGIAEALTVSEVTPFRMQIAGLGVFPEYDYISVIWLGVRTGASTLTTLHESIEDVVTRLGYSDESFDFLPHVTIARMEHGEAKDTVQQLLRTRDPQVGDMMVTDICLTESVLTADGPVYSTLTEFPLNRDD